MRYGYFDNARKEYVITRPDTPTAWMNYIGNGGFGGIVSNTGGGLTFDKDPSYRRVTRYHFDALPKDRPGRYLYIRNQESGTYWSPLWQPVMKELQTYECRHGRGYTTITGTYDDIKTAITYLVPLAENFELWQVEITNLSDIQKTLRLFSYVEFSWNHAFYDVTNHWPRMAFVARGGGNKIVVDTMAQQLTGVPQYDYIAASLPVDGWDCSQAAFIGPYRSESNPLAVENGVCGNSNMDSDNCVGALQSTITLLPGQTLRFCYTLGATSDQADIDGQISRAFSLQNCVEDIRKSWDDYSNHLVVDTPHQDMNDMLNIWHAYQTKTTFDWSRFVSVYEPGITRGFGFRDSMQDVLGVMHAVPQLAKERMKLLLSIQKSDGSARNVYYPFTRQSQGEGRSDDHLWSVFSVCNYVKETGDLGFLKEDVPYVDSGSATVLGHLEQALQFTHTHLGRHGIPDMLRGDWDDSVAHMTRGGTAHAESVFVFFQLAQGAYELMELYKAAGLPEKIPAMQAIFEDCQKKLPVIWDGEWFIRAFTGEGEKYCTHEDEFNKIHLIPQCWSVISRAVPEDQCNTAMDNVMKYLYTERGLITHFPASSGFVPEKKSYFLFPAGARENGGIFFHSNTWAVMAYAMLGRGEEAFKCYESSLPNRRNDIADLCLTEPYVYSQTMLAPPHPRAGACVNSWLTGTASWMYLVATQYILGIRPEYDGLCIDPQLPADWPGFAATRQCRGAACHITVEKGENKGLYVDGQRIEGNTVPWALLETEKTLNIQLIY